MGSQESLPYADPNADVITVKDQNLKHIPYLFSKDNQVHAIDFTGNQIETIPSTLTSLISICLSKNNYHQIPKGVLDFIQKSHNLQYLDFSNNYFKEIPHQLQKIESLKKITFFNNLLEEVNNLPDNLEGIELGQNLITKFPTISHKMQRLSLNYNHIAILDSGSPSLTHLFCNMNEILEIRPNIIFQQLTHLQISKNNIRNLPDLSIITPCLIKIDASVNLIEKFPNFPNSIKTVNLAKNKIRDLPNNIINLHHLENISIEKNQITRVPLLPPTVKTVLLSLNQIKSMTEMSLHHLSNLALMKNKLESQPPIRNSHMEEYILLRNCIREIKIEYLSENITKLNFSDNFIETIPELLFSSLPNLTCLHLYKNKLHSLPDSISQSKLTVLNFSENPFDSFPQNLPMTLTTLYCGNCNLNEMIIDVSKFPQLKTIDASGNRIKSFQLINETTSLHNLYLSSNMIESILVNLPLSLIVLDLSRNCISHIPEKISKLRNLKDLSLSYNNLSSFPSVVFDSLFSLKVDHNPNLSFSFDVSQHPKLQNIDISNSHSILLNETRQIREIITSKRDNDISNHKFISDTIDTFVGYSEMCGRRAKMEDSIVVRPNIYADVDLYAIFDGHNGSETADFCSFNLPKYFDDETKDEQIKHALQFIKSPTPKSVGKNKTKDHLIRPSTAPNERFSEDYCNFVCESLEKSLETMNFNNGSTMAMVLMNQNEIIISHLGDTRVLLISETGKIKHVTSDHKPQRQDELKRILDCGGKVVNGRLDGIIAMSRSLGDFEVVGLGNEPTITRIPLEKEDKWVVIACDGLFEVMTNSEVASYTSKIESPVEYSYLLRNIAHCRLSLDNISIIAVNLFERFRLTND